MYIKQTYKFLPSLSKMNTSKPTITVTITILLLLSEIRARRSSFVWPGGKVVKMIGASKDTHDVRFECPLPLHRPAALFINADHVIRLSAMISPLMLHMMDDVDSFCICSPILEIDMNENFQMVILTCYFK